MTMTYSGHESYRAALLETDWRRMQERVKAAEAEIREPQSVLSMDHGGTPEERQAIDDAISGMKVLRREAAEWQHREVSEVRLLTLELTKRASLQASKCDHLRPAILSSQIFF